MSTGRLLLDHPDPGMRLQKQLWSQLTELLVSAIQAAVAGRNLQAPCIAFQGLPPRMEETLRMGRSWTSTSPSGPMADASSPHVTVLILGSHQLHEATASIRSAHDRTRPGGSLILICPVVSTEGHDALPMEDFMESINEGTGTRVHLDDMRSIRWANEPFHRHAFLSLTVLKTSRETA